MEKECVLYEKKESKKVRCYACANRCLIANGKKGICSVRENKNGKLFLLVYGKPCAVHIDPIEKKPLYHFLPGTRTFSIGTVGCNFKCKFCQNWDISQAKQVYGVEFSPKGIVEEAVKYKCPSISYTYTEPAIFAEFVHDTAVLAKKKGLKNILVTNGYFTKESFDYLSKYIDAMNIDLKSFSEKTYLEYCGAKLKPVLETIKLAHKKKIHIEITTLVIPDINDSEKELEKVAKFIASVDKNIPWHVSRFFPNYKLMDKIVTPIETLRKAEKIGKKYLKFVYLGNV